MKRYMLAGSFLIFIVCIPLKVFSAGYYFKQMWPELEQPWYFIEPTAISVDAFDNIFVVDRYNSFIQKYSSKGIFIAQWGGGLDAPSNGIVHDSKGNIYVIDYEGPIQKIKRRTPDLKPSMEWEVQKMAQPPDTDIANMLAIDGNDFLYIINYENLTIQKYETDGTFVLEWGGTAGGGGQFNKPTGIAVDSDNSIYVMDAEDYCVKIFESDGTYISQWETFWAQQDTYYTPSVLNITISPLDEVYINKPNGDVRKYSRDGILLSSYCGGGGKDIAFDSKNTIYAISVSGSFVIRRLTPDCDLISQWDSHGPDVGEFFEPKDIVSDTDGYVYVADSENNRIQKFTSDGEFVTQLGSYNGGGILSAPVGLMSDNKGNLFVIDGNRVSDIEQFTTGGKYIGQWKKSACDPAFLHDGLDGINWSAFFCTDASNHLSIDAAGFIYIVKTGDHIIQKYSPDALLLSQWGSQGAGNGQFEKPTSMAIDSDGYLYVADSGNYRIQKLTPDGEFISEFGEPGSGDGQFGWISDIIIDPMDNLFVADQGNNRIQQFTTDGTFITKWGSGGSKPGQFVKLEGLHMSGSGDIYTVDSYLNRVQVFSPKGFSKPDLAKAIIVAGGGNTAENNLWDATRYCTDHVYKVLAYQGYTNDTIKYLSSGQDLDLDSNGILDDIDGDATKLNLEKAVTTWASDATDLLLYITDHGGHKQFRMNSQELLSAQELDDWLNQHQAVTGSQTTIVYDACMAGSFLETLASPYYDRVFIASADKDQQAHFMSTGQVSFSHFFWTHIFNGMSLYDAFIKAHDAVNASYPNQKPLVNGDGNESANELSDMESIKGMVVGDGILSGEDIPFIGSVSGGITLYGDTEAIFIAENVIDSNGIARVWGVVTPPDAGGTDPSQPVTDLPEIEFMKISDSSYKGEYDGFIAQGIYHIAVFARDTNGVLSIPRTTTVVQNVGLDYAVVDAAMNMSIPCIEFGNVSYQILLNHYPHHPAGPDVFWKLDMNGAYLNQTGSGECAAMDSDFRISIPKIEFQGQYYKAVLEQILNPQDLFGHYWKMDLTLVEPI